MSSIIHYNSKFKISWDAVTILAIIISLIVVPYEVIFLHESTVTSNIIYYLLSAFFFFDIFIIFRTSIKEHNDEIMDRKTIKKHYLKSSFWIDILGAIPFGIFFIGSSIEIFNEPIILVLRLNVIFRLRRFFSIFNTWTDFHWVNTGYLRLIRFIVVMIVLIHLISCLWYWTAYSQNFPELSWVALQGLVDAEPITQYIRSLYWTITTMTTIGYGDITPHTNNEYIFVTIIMLLGATMYAYIIGNIASIVSNIDTLKNEHEGRKESILLYLRQNHTSNHLMNKITNYYDYIWKNKKGVNEKEMFENLPQQLKLELMLDLSKDLLNKVNLFKYSSKGLQEELLTRMELNSYPPKVTLSYRSTFSSGIYFISKGSLSVYGEDESVEKSVLETGEYFGVVPMILGEPSGGTIITKEYCEMFFLPRKSFNELKENVSEFNDLLKEVSKKKSEKDLELFMEGIII